MVARAVAVVALATVALAGVVSAQNSFCEQYTGVLFGSATNATLQANLVSAVVLRAATGGSGSGQTVVGLFNDPLNKGYFNGTLPPRINYQDSANAAALTALVLHLNQFFQLALGCRAASALNPWNPTARGVTMKGLHAAMNINNAIETSFVNQVATSLASFGVTLGDGSAGTEAAYAGALFSQFNRYQNTPDTNNFQICGQLDCPMAHQIHQFTTGTDGTFSALNTASLTPTVNSGDYVNFRFASAATGSGVTEVDSSTSTAAKSGGMSSAASTMTYTVQMNTPGTYYWISNGATSSRVQVTVVATPSSSTGGSSMGSTATGGAAATASLGFAAVLAVAAAAIVVA